MDKMQKKRSIIISVYVLLLLVFFGMLFYWLNPDPNCFDNEKNQNELGVDCGGICVKKCEAVAEKDILIESAELVESGVIGTVDAFAVVRNPNQLFGSSNFSYEFRVKNAAGAVIASRKGNNYILPGEKKYIMEIGILSEEQAASAEVEIKDAQWIEAGEYYEKPQLKIATKKYNEALGGVDFGEARGLLENGSVFDFNSIKILVALKDVSGKVLAINSTKINTVKAGENRDFKVSWPNRFSGSVSDMDVQADVNIFDSESFMQRNFLPQRFQQSQ